MTEAITLDESADGPLDREEKPLGLFEAYGIELEYMIVDAQSLDVRPIADVVLSASGDVEREHTAWSNELVLQVVELKTNGPAPSLTPLAGYFQADVREIDAMLASHGARLLGTAMHPWFDPKTETKLWPHEYNEVYRTLDRIFDAKGHGWSNLQSMHINLPFANADEFGRLHAAIRAVLPILPALAASSPLVEGRATGIIDNRLHYYRSNSRRIPSVTGKVIPEPVYSPEAYRTQILERIWADAAPLDPEGVLAHEWANARGAIARFDRDAIEIRVLDLQESPTADLAVAALVVATVRALASEKWITRTRLESMEVAPLHTLFLACVTEGEEAVLSDQAYLEALGYPGAIRTTARELWQHLVENLSMGEAPLLDPAWRTTLDPLLAAGTLSRRILRAVGPDTRKERIAEVYRALADHLAAGTLFS